MARREVIAPAVGREFIRQRIEPHLAEITDLAVSMAKGAKQKKFFAHEGHVVETADVIDNDATLRAQDQVHRLLGNYAQKERSAPGAITVVINLEGQPAARLSVGKGSTTTGSVDAVLTPSHNAVLKRKYVKTKRSGA